MPTYEYACRECGEHLEVVQSFKDDSLTDCPACDREGTLRKVFSAAGIIFKGSGWHIKDYSSAKNAAAGPSDTATSSDDSGSGTDSGTSDTKPGKPAKSGKSTSDAGASGSKNSGSTSSGSSTGSSEAKSA